MTEQLSFLPVDPFELHKQVEKELGRVDGEDWEDFQEIVRYEVNSRLQEMNKSKSKPQYKDIDKKEKIEYNNFVFLLNSSSL